MENTQSTSRTFDKVKAFLLRVDFPPLRGGIKGGETFKTEERFRAADQSKKMVLLYLFAC